MSFTDYWLHVASNHDVSARLDNQSTARGHLEFGLAAAVVDSYAHHLVPNGMTGRKHFEDFGGYLFSALVAGEIREHFGAAYAKTQAAGHVLRIRLSFDPGLDDIEALPWEFMFRHPSSTSDGYFVSTHPLLSLTRYHALRDANEPLAPLQQFLRILIVVSRPRNLGGILHEPAVKPIADLAMEKKDVFERPIMLYDPAIEDLASEIERVQPHIIHFIGHGKLDGAGFLGLCDRESREVVWLDDQRFGELFLNCKPRLLLLQACEGASIGSAYVMAGVARQLIHRNLQAVVGLQFEVSNLVATEFYRAFYTCLSENDSVDEAIQTGRRAIALGRFGYETRDFGAPVLFLRSTDGYLFRRSKQDEMPTEHNGAERGKSMTEYEAIHAYLESLSQAMAALQVPGSAKSLTLEDHYVELKTVEHSSLLLHPQVSQTAPDAEGGLADSTERSNLELWEVFSAIQEFGTLTVVGHPGSGKTTLLRYIALQYTKQRPLEGPVPFFVTLNDFSRLLRNCQPTPGEGSILIHYLAGQFADYTGYPYSQSVPLLARLIRQGALVLLLDGLDEVLDSDLRRLVVDEINRFLATRNNCPVVVTSRIALFEVQLPNLGTQQTLQIKELGTRQIEALVARLFHKPLQAKGFLKLVNSSPSIRMLAGNPLLLSLMALVYQTHGNLPLRRADLYERCVKVLLTGAHSHLGLQFEGWTEEKLEILRCIAFHFYSRVPPSTVFELSECQNAIYDESQSLGLGLDRHGTRQLCNEMIEQHGILKLMSLSTCAFVHRTFQEFLAAQYIVRRGNLHLAKATITEARWNNYMEEMALLLIGQLDKDTISSVLGRVLEEQDDVFQTGLLFVGTALVEAVEVDEELRAKVIDRLMQVVEQNTLRYLRWKCRDILAALGGGEVQSFFLSILVDDQVDWDARGGAALAISRMPYMGRKNLLKAMNSLLAILQDPACDSYIQERAATALDSLTPVLSRSNREFISSALADVMRTPTISSRVRRRAARALVSSGGHNAAQFLCHTLKDTHESPYVRGEAAYSLAHIDPGVSIPNLKGIYSDSMVDGFGRLASLRAIAAVVDDAAALALVEIVSREKEQREFLTESVETLGHLQPNRRVIKESVLPLLVELVQKPFYGVRMAALQSLTDLADQSCVAALRAVLNEREPRNPEEQVQAARILGRLGDAAGLATLECLAIHSNDLSVQLRAISSIGEAALPEAVHILGHMLQRVSNLEIVNAVIDAIGATHQTDGSAYLIAYFSENVSRNTLVATRIMRSLEKSGDEDAVSVLEGALVSAALPEPVLISACKALGRIGGESTGRILETVADSAALGWRIRAAAIESLALVGTESAVSSLVHLMQNPSIPSFVRSAAYFSGLQISRRYELRVLS